MTLATLVVKLEASTSQFKREMEGSARHIEAIGKRIQRAGMEISTAISLPIIAAGLAAFKLALDESHRSFGPLFMAYQSLKGAIYSVVLAIGQQLTPVFLQIIQAFRDTVVWVGSLVTAFRQLPPWIQNAAVKTLLFLAAIGPTVVIIGKFVKVLGAIPALFGVLMSSTGLLVIAIVALVGAMAYVVTHWQHMGHQLTLVWTMVEEGVFAAVSGILGAFSKLLDGGMDTVFADMRKSFDAWSDSVLASQAAKILANDLAEATTKMKTFAEVNLDVKKVMDDFAEAQRRLNEEAIAMGPSFNFAAAQAVIMKQRLDGLIGTGWLTTGGLRSLGDVINETGRRGKLFADMMQAVSKGIGDSFTQLGEQFGNILGGIAHGFHDFGHVLEGLLGNMLTSVGQVLIAFGTAGIAIKAFAINPLAAIAAGVAMIALGSALSGAAQRALDASSAGGGTGGGAAPAAPAAASAAEPQGTGTINIYGDPYLDMSNPVVRDRFSQALRDARNFRDIEINWKPA